MVALPLVLVLGIATFVVLKKKKIKGWQMALGTALGLALAATALGRPITSGVQAMSSAAGNLVVSAAKATPAFLAELAKEVGS